MSSATGPREPSATTGLVGLAADGLADMLDDALNGDDTPAIPPAFAKDGAPYSLDELLCGLEPVSDGPDLRLEPALLLAEVSPPAGEPANDWAAGEPANDWAAPTPAPPEPAVQAVLDMAAAEETPSAIFAEDEVREEHDPTTSALASIASALEALARQDAAEADPPSPPSPPAAVDDDVLELTDDYLVQEATPEPEVPPEADAAEPEWDPTTLTLGNLVAALHALAEDGARPSAGDTTAPETGDTTAPETGDDDVLVLTDDFLAAEQAPQPEQRPEPAPKPEAAPEPLPEPQPEPEVAAAPVDAALAAELAARRDAIIAAHRPTDLAPPAGGDDTLPERLDALAVLLADPPPPNDFAALDALYACWPKGTQDSASRALLAAAHNLSRNFGLPAKLPMAAAKAWRMLSPTVFEAELAQRLADVGTFIAEWQKTQRTFLILEFGEVELIEYLFEALHPGYHAQALAGVMNFKVLSNRRMGLLRRIPNRARKQITPLLPDRKEQALVELAHVKALLEQVAGETGFAPIADTAGKAQEEIEKMMKAVANIGAPPPPPGGGLALGKIG